MTKIPVRGGDMFAFEKTEQFTKTQILEMARDIEDLFSLAKTECEILRVKIEKNPAFFSELLQKFMIVKTAEMESLMAVSEMLSNILIEFSLNEMGIKEGGA